MLVLYQVGNISSFTDITAICIFQNVLDLVGLTCLID